MKLCGKCGSYKSFIEFYKRNSGKRSGEYYEKCKECYKSRGRSYYHINRKRQLELAKQRKVRYIRERKKFLQDIKDKPCADCGKRYPAWVMDFDHKGASKKLGSVSFLTFRKLVNIEKIIKEIKKCDLVCSNCHRHRTYLRLQKKRIAEVANVVKAPL